MGQSKTYLDRTAIPPMGSCWYWYAEQLGINVGKQRACDELCGEKEEKRSNMPGKDLQLLHVCFGQKDSK